MKRIIIESPYHADTPEGIAANVEYARRCLRYVLDLGHAPLASHLLYPQVLNDGKPEERARGIAAGLAWGEYADEVWIFCDRGLSTGMQNAILQHHANMTPVIYYYLDYKPPSAAMREPLGSDATQGENETP